jgi:hypothetical protein
VVTNLAVAAHCSPLQPGLDRWTHESTSQIVLGDFRALVIAAIFTQSILRFSRKRMTLSRVKWGDAFGPD